MRKPLFDGEVYGLLCYQILYDLPRNSYRVVPTG